MNITSMHSPTPSEISHAVALLNTELRKMKEVPPKNQDKINIRKCEAKIEVLKGADVQKFNKDMQIFWSALAADKWKKNEVSIYDLLRG